jgi:hypothetical protein
MTTIAQTDCCTMLGIDPKTLRHWLRQANMQLIAHSTDARLKCLTEAQVQQLAALHNRPLSSVLPAQAVQANEALPLSPTPALPSCGNPEADRGQSWLRLQAQVATLQEQLTELALQLLRERELRLQWLQERQEHTQRRLDTLEALLTPAAEPSRSAQAPQKAAVTDLSHFTPSQERSARPRAAREHRSLLPLIAYTATGSYVAISPTTGELPLLPDSPEWFDWLATLPSFRFVGQHGRLSTYRSASGTSWIAYRRIHGRRYNYGLGHTKLLTIAHLEHMAATLQSYASSLS